MTAAVTTSAHDAAERRLAARALLLTPVLTTDRHPDTMRLVRRHGPALRAMFATQLGYTLVVESTFARLLKAPPEPAFPARPARRADRQPGVPADDSLPPTAGTGRPARALGCPRRRGADASHRGVRSARLRQWRAHGGRRRCTAGAGRRPAARRTVRLDPRTRRRARPGCGGAGAGRPRVRHPARRRAQDGGPRTDPWSGSPHDWPRCRIEAMTCGRHLSARTPRGGDRR
jgi:hypothetical protein